MERILYQLQIDADYQHFESITSILGLAPKNYKNGWCFEVVWEAEQENYNTIDKFTDIIIDKYSELYDIGVQRSDITIWIIYEYSNQCNMEFLPETLRKIGESGVTLCISCYKS